MKKERGHEQAVILYTHHQMDLDMFYDNLKLYPCVNKTVTFQMVLTLNQTVLVNRSDREKKNILKGASL